MQNTIYSAEDLYQMLRNMYLKTFPYSPRLRLAQNFTNIYMFALNDYFKTNNVPAYIIFTESFKQSRMGAFEHNIAIEKDLDLLNKFNEKEQSESILFIENELERQKTAIMLDMVELHRWLYKNDFLGYSESEKAHYIQEKFIEKESLFN